MAQEGLRFTVLGPVRAWRGDIEVDLGPPQQRAMLALLLIRAGQPVSPREIVDALWALNPPVSAVNIVHRQVGMLRRLFEPGLATRAVGRWLIRGAGGYQLDADTRDVDLLHFRHLVGQARHLAAEQPERAVPRFVEALDLWRGPVASGIDPLVRAGSIFVDVDRERRAAALEAADLALRIGRAEWVLAAVRHTALDNPLDEPLQARLILALAMTGWRADALRVYELVRARLASELAVDPSPELRAAHEWVLHQSAAAGFIPTDVRRDAAGPAAMTRPAQLPADLAAFTGRQPEIAKLQVLATDAARSRTVVIGAIGGMAGIGKTALAVHGAHQVADQFPDGQLYVNLRGFDRTGSSLSPAEAVRGFLDAFDVSPHRIPAGLDAQAALYRRVLAGRRVLIVLDNASDTEQVRPLLPGTPGCLVIVTSRHELTGLVAADGAHPFNLDLLPTADTRVFLVRRLSADRVAAEPEAVEKIIAACAGLPLALAVVAARAAHDPLVPLGSVAAELNEARGSLDAFSHGDEAADVRAVFSWSYRALDAATARLFRQLALHEGPDISAPAVASLAGVSVRDVRALLTELAHAHLINQHGDGRYAFHDLLHDYATELGHTHDTADERRGATRRLLDHYLHTAHAADRRLSPHREPAAVDPPEPHVRPEVIVDREHALRWLTAEHRSLLAAIDQAARDGFGAHARQLASAVGEFLNVRGHWADWAVTERTALDAALREANQPGQARSHCSLGMASFQLGLLAEAQTHLTEALELYVGLDDPAGQATTHRGLAAVLTKKDDYPSALDHAERALSLYRAGHKKSGLANALNEVGWYSALLGDYPRALDYCQQALDLLTELGDRRGEAAAWDSLGYIHHHLDDQKQAIICYQRAADLRQKAGDRHPEATTLRRLGDVHHHVGDHDAARDAWQRALTILTQLDHPDADVIRQRIIEDHDRTSPTKTTPPVAISSEEASPPEDVPELLGRTQELTLLRAFLAASARDGGCLVLSGEPGVGKTTLLDAATRQARSAGARILRAAGVEFETDLSYSALNQLLVPLHRDFDQLGAAHREALSVALGFGTGKPADRLVVCTAAWVLLRQVAEVRPLLLVVDDLPWLDRSSAGVLSFVARRLAGTRIGLLAAARAGDDSFFERTGMPGIDVRPLDDDAAVTLLSRHFPGLPVQARQRVLAQAQGNPLALMELPVPLNGGPVGSPVTSAVQAAGGRLRAHFTSRVAQLPAASRQLLLLAALHDGGDLGLLDVAAPEQDGLVGLTAAQRAGLVVINHETRRFEFRHPLVRSAVVATATAQDRRHAHRALAALLADQPERRAWHLAESSVEPDEQVASLLEYAAHSVLRRGDAVAAVAALLRAADLSPRGADRSRRLAEAAYVGANVAGQLRTIPQLLVDARRADPELSGSLEAAVATAYLLINGEGDVDTAHSLLVGAIETGADGYDASDRALTEALHTLLTVCWFAGRADLWSPFHEAVARLKPRAPVVLSLCGQIFADPAGASSAALDELDSVISGLHEETDPARIVRIGMAALFTDRMRRCQEAHWRVIRDGRQGGAVASAIVALVNVCLDDLLTGGWDEAGHLADEGLELCRAHGYRLLQWPFWFAQAFVAAGRGDDEQARALADSMTQWAAPKGVRVVQWYSSHIRALAALSRGDFESAYQQTCAISPPGVFASHVPLAGWDVMNLVESAVRTDRPAEAAAHIAATRAAGLTRLSPRLALLAGGAVAIAAPDDRAAELFRDALALPDVESWPFDRARVQLAYGERLRRSGATSDSRVHLTAARDTFLRLGAQPWAVRAADELLATGHSRQRSRKSTGQARLTPQEFQIATLAASGLSNKQIGERIFLSHRTVSDHLYRIFPKLGITSRAALRDALAALPARPLDQKG